MGNSNALLLSLLPLLLLSTEALLARRVDMRDRTVLDDESETSPPTATRFEKTGSRQGFRCSENKRKVSKHVGETTGIPLSAW